MTDFLRFSFLAAAIAASAGTASAAPRENCGPDALGTARVIEIGGEALPLGRQSYPRTLDLRDHEVALTFDDGPAAPTARLLDALAKECVRATFFIVGHNAEALPALVKREVAEGHSVGHHSYSHPARTLRLMSFEAARADIEKGVAADEKAGHGAASDKPRTPFFRFPGFADTPELLAYLAGRGITVFGSDLWASDWNEMTPQAELELVLSRLEKEGKGIVLFHDSKLSTAQMLPDFLRELKKRGFSVAHMVPGAGPTPVANAGPGWKSTTEPIVQKTLGGKTRGGHAHAPDDSGPTEKGMR